MRIGASLSVILAGLAGAANAGPVDVEKHHGHDTTQVHGCWGDEHGHLSGGIFDIPMDAEVLEFIEAMNQANQGVVDNRVDLVFVGDGYTASEQAQFQTDVDGIVDSLYQYEPFTSYQSYFRVTAVEVISNESGVDNDPSQGIMRDTALDMTYWCSNIERLLCVSVGKAYTAAAAAPDIDQVVAVSNSSKYGGAGYPSNNLGTSAGQNGAAADIAIHELGHSLGDLADEYTYGGPTTYTGGELTPVDVSIYNRQEQIDQERKWHYWMDANLSGFDGPVSAFEGGNYSEFGVYRPSNNSMMRSLGRPFNLVSAERLIRQIYREVNPIDDGPANGTAFDRNDVISITPMQPLNHTLSVYWYVDDQFQIDLFGQTAIDISSLDLDNDAHEIRVEVIDEINWVRNENIRDNFMTESRTYTIAAASNCDADLVADGSLNFLDVSQFLTLYGQGDLQVDFVDDGSLNFLDVSAFLGLYGAGCP
ncbi:MAG: M64 family metallopeptidase [Phycisphaerales bacterium]